MMSPASARSTVLIANPAADLYGSDRMMLEAVRGLLERNWRVVVTCSQHGALVEPLEELGAEVRVLDAPVVRKAMMTPMGLARLLRHIVCSLPRMARLVRTVRPQVVLVNTLTIPVWLLAARLSGVPPVVYVHEAEASVPRWARLTLSAPLLLARRVIFNSEASRRVSSLRLLERLRRTTVVANGVRGPERITPARAEVEPPVRLLFVGRLSPRKGPDLVIQAAARLAQRGLPTEVDLVGSVVPGHEWYERELRELTQRLGLAGVVRFHGFQRSVWPHLAAADIAVVPSRMDESFGNTVIESLLAGRPVIVSDHTGLRIAGSGFEAVQLIDADDIEAVAHAVKRVIADWHAFRAKACTDACVAEERFGVSRFHAAIAEVLAAASLPRKMRIRNE